MFVETARSANKRNLFMLAAFGLLMGSEERRK